MTKRGRVLRDTTSGPGLLMMEGQQYRFSLEGVWKSETPPKPGVVVDVELDARGKVQGITVVSLVTRSVMPSLAAAGLLSAACFLLTAASIQVPFPGKLEFTFWQILAFLNAGSIPQLLDGNRSPGAGVYGLVAILALLGPLIHHFWKDKRALLGGLLPLAFMVVVGIALRGGIHGALGSGNEGSADVGKQTHEAMKAVSLGLGTYLSILASLYFAFTSAKGFLVATASEGQGQESTQRKAA